MLVDYAKKFYSHLARVNSPDITIEYKTARFFVIKSFSEEDVHKSMKYQVWSSTPEGNKRLNEAYQKCVAEKVPLFLFFRYSCPHLTHLVSTDPASSSASPR